MSFLLQKASRYTVWFIIVPALVVNLILTTTLFYILVPLISTSHSLVDSTAQARKTLTITGADAVIIWAVNLNANDRKLSSFIVANIDDNDIFSRYVADAQNLKLTSAMPPSMLQSLLAGDGICYSIKKPGVVPSSTIGDFLKDNPEAMSCAYPISNKSTGIISAYVIMIWKRKLSAEEQTFALQQARTLYKQL